MKSPFWSSTWSSMQKVDDGVRMRDVLNECGLQPGDRSEKFVWRALKKAGAIPEKKRGGFVYRRAHIDIVKQALRSLESDN